MRQSLYHRQRVIHYPETLGERLYSIFLGPILFIIVISVILKILTFAPGTFHHVDISDLAEATGYTFLRLVIAYSAALIFAIPLAMLATLNPTAEKIFLPIFDIMESVPVLAFFPVLILFFISINMVNTAAVFILFLAMLWNIVFTVAGGLKMIPRDITYAARVFGIRKWRYFKEVILPGVFPEIVTGSILAFAQGWNLIIVAEVMHTYIPGGTPADDLYGIGSLLVGASASSQTDIFLAALAIMIICIAFLNYFVWQKLIHYAERFKFE